MTNRSLSQRPTIRPRRGRMVPAFTPRLPALVPELDLTTELPSDDELARPRAVRQRIGKLYRGRRHDAGPAR
jgi:hypothetical protein